jgi:hypothetical protein
MYEEYLGRRDHQVLKESRVPLVNRDQKAYKACKVSLDPLVPQVLLDLKVKKEPQALVAHRVTQVPRKKVIEALLVHKVLQDPLVPQVLVDHPVRKVTKALLVHKVLKGRAVSQDNQVERVKRVILEPQS